MRLRQWQRGDSEVILPSEEDTLITKLYECYAPKLLAYIHRHIPSLDNAEDLLLEVFLVALEHERDLAVMPVDEQRAWLWTVAHNKVIDYARHHRRHQQVALEHIADMMSDELVPEQAVLQDEEYAHLRNYLKRLSASQQKVLHLRFACDLRCAEIAALLNKREGAIRTMLSRAIQSLRDIYER